MTSNADIIGAPDCLMYQIVTITGTTEKFTYSGYRDLIKKFGGIFTEYISNRTTMLIYGSGTEDGHPIDTSNKWKEAQEENTKAAIGERGFKPAVGNVNSSFKKVIDGKVVIDSIEILSEEDFIAWIYATATPRQRSDAFIKAAKKPA